jgi:hypothetical protein
MESDNLRTASLYINNQLLSRGLLRNGQNIDFARPEKGEGGVEGTMGAIMKIVNDLILRRDVRPFHHTFVVYFLTKLSSATQHNAKPSLLPYVAYAPTLCDKLLISNAYQTSMQRRNGSWELRRRQSTR